MLERKHIPTGVPSIPAEGAWGGGKTSNGEKETNEKDATVGDGNKEQQKSKHEDGQTSEQE